MERLSLFLAYIYIYIDELNEWNYVRNGIVKRVKLTIFDVID